MLSFPMRSRGGRANGKRPANEQAGRSAFPGASGIDAGTQEMAGRDGWYSSSFELMDGLEVTEDIPLDGLPADWTDSFDAR